MSILNNTKINEHKHENQYYLMQKANLQLIINGTNNNETLLLISNLWACTSWKDRTKCKKILHWILEDHQKDSTGMREKQVHNIAW